MPSKDKLPLLGQLVKLIPAKSIDSFARKYEIQTRSFSPTSHVVTMMYAQLSHSLSLNDVCDALQNHVGALSQIRHCTPPSRNGLSHANRTRNADMAEELFWNTLEYFRKDFPSFISTGRNYPGLPHRFKRMIHAVDSSTIPLVANCLEWAKHRRQKAAAKLHMNLDMQSFLPSFAIVRTAKQSDSKAAWEVCAHLKAGEIAVFDKAYVDFKHLYHLDQRQIFWVTRSKGNMQYEVMGQQVRKKRKYKQKKIKIISDERIRLTTPSTAKHYPQELRLVTAEVEVKKKMVVMKFITNNLTWAATSVCELYRARWGIEVFFKEIKQTLQLADFMGHNENAVRWQIWISLLVYLLLRFIAWEQSWKHSFNRLFTLIRGVIWNYFNLSSVLISCDTMGRRKLIRATPERCYQTQFVFG